MFCILHRKISGGAFQDVQLVGIPDSTVLNILFHLILLYIYFIIIAKYIML